MFVMSNGERSVEQLDDREPVNGVNASRKIREQCRNIRQSSPEDMPLPRPRVLGRCRCRGCRSGRRRRPRAGPAGREIGQADPTASVRNWQGASVRLVTLSLRWTRVRGCARRCAALSGSCGRTVVQAGASSLLRCGRDRCSRRAPHRSPSCRAWYSARRGCSASPVTLCAALSAASARGRVPTCLRRAAGC